MAGTAASPERVDPWRLARDTADRAGVSLRPLRTPDDADLLLGVLSATWGGQEMAREIVVALAESGNVCWGAFDGATILGYVLGWAGVDAEGLHVHSHMLATLAPARGRGIGAALKFAQRAQALDQGIGVVRWTFDPMVTRNAIFNLNRLGTTADRFHRDFYGAMGDPMNRGERSDRLVARWDLVREPGPRALPDDAVRVPVPAEGARGASAAREAVATAIEEALGAGLVAGGFDVEASAFVFVPPGATA
ncbi:MAG: GNAT family N-acetyltransferase [Actinomycetota bacterium]